jgi:large subunit ribosomal protein L22
MAQATTNTNEFRAEARHQRTSPQKAKLVLDMIKGLRVETALNTVHFTQKRVAPIVEKVLQSAVANAKYLSDERGLDVDIDNLYVKTAIANEGPRAKRIRPAPMGRAYRYQRRTAHIIVTVAEKKSPETVKAEAVAAAAAPVEVAAPAAKKSTAKKPHTKGATKGAEKKTASAAAKKKAAAPKKK